MAVSPNVATLLRSASSPVSKFPGDLMLQGENAYQLLAEQLANLDTQQGQVGTDYERQRGEAGYQNQDMVQSIMDAMANRGTLRSGLTNRAMARQGRNYTGILDKLANARQQALSGIAGQRLSAQGGYNQTMGNIQSAFAGQSSQAIQNQLQAAAQAAQQQQQSAFNNALTAQNQALQQSVLNQTNSYNNLLGAIGGAATTPTTGTTGPSGTINPTPSGAPAIAGQPPKPTPIQPKPTARPYPTAPTKPRAV